MTINHKDDFRKYCIERLKFYCKISKYYKSKIILKELKSVIRKENAKNILLYIPLGNEVDVLALIKELRKEKKNIYVPFLYKDSFKIVKYRLPLYKKKFGLKEPCNSFLAPNKIDLAIVPTIGVDSLYKRIGFGKGMYDRFFSALGYRPIIVFTQIVFCKSKNKLSNDYDIQADYIIT